MDLHGQIMNLPTPDYAGLLATPDYAAKIGHRDARHAAAELAIKADACIKALREIIESCERNQAAVSTFLLIDAREALAGLDGRLVLANV